MLAIVTRFAARQYMVHVGVHAKSSRLEACVDT